MPLLHRAFGYDRSGAIAPEMAVCLAFMTIALLGLVEVGIAKTQEQYADHGYAVFGELVMSHEGDLACSDLDDYFQLALEAYTTGNIGGQGPQGDFSANSTSNEPFAVRVAGVEVVRESSGNLRSSIAWHAFYDESTDFTVDQIFDLPSALETEGEFYLIVEGHTRIAPAFGFLFHGDDALVIHNFERQILTPRYQSKLTAAGRQSANCRFQA